MSIELKLFGIGLLYAVTIGGGFWLSHSGKPLNTLIFTIHKLVALAAVVVTAVLFWNLLKSVDTTAAILAVIIAWGLSVVALFVTGAVLSGKVADKVMLMVHRFTPVVWVIAAGAGFFILVK